MLIQAYHTVPEPYNVHKNPTSVKLDALYMTGQHSVMLQLGMCWYNIVMTSCVHACLAVNMV